MRRPLHLLWQQIEFALSLVGRIALRPLQASARLAGVGLYVSGKRVAVMMAYFGILIAPIFLLTESLMSVLYAGIDSLTSILYVGVDSLMSVLGSVMETGTHTLWGGIAQLASVVALPVSNVRNARRILSTLRNKLRQRRKRELTPFQQIVIALLLQLLLSYPVNKLWSFVWDKLFP